jgi:hypothetical protein
MAEERNLGLARAPESTDDEATSKAELQRRMEEARESISQTVEEIKDTVANQYQAVRETINDTLDWREQFKRRPVAFSVGALSAGFIVGYGLAGAFKGGGSSDYDDDDYDSPRYLRGDSETHSYAAKAITGSAFGASSYAPQSSMQEGEVGVSRSRASAGGNYETEFTLGESAPNMARASVAPSAYPAAPTVSDAEEDKGPGLIERFKETKAYDRLEEEIGALGDRFVNELSKTAQTVVLPALFSKVKEYFGFDLSGKSQSAGASSGAGASRSSAASSGGASSQASGSQSGGQSSSASAGSASGASGSSYGTSENRSYGNNESGNESHRGGSSQS